MTHWLRERLVKYKLKKENSAPADKRYPGFFCDIWPIYLELALAKLGVHIITWNSGTKKKTWKYTWWSPHKPTHNSLVKVPVRTKVKVAKTGRKWRSPTAVSRPSGNLERESNRWNKPQLSKMLKYGERIRKGTATEWKKNPTCIICLKIKNSSII